MPTINVNQTLGGEITSTDPRTNQENWTVTLKGNTTYTIRAMGQGNGSYTLGDPYIEGVFRGGTSGTFVGFNNDGLIAGPYGRDAMFTFTTPTHTDTSYTIVVTGDRFTTGTYGVSVSNSSGATDSVAASTATNASVAVGGSVTGTIDAAISGVNDSDWYRVALVAGTSYSIRMRGLTGGGGTLPDPSISGLYDAGGRYIVNSYVDDISTRDASLKFVAPYSGDYYIAASGWSTYTGTFTLDVAVAGSDVVSNTGTTATIEVGGSATVQIEQPYDHDWYGVSLVAGTTYQFTLAGTGYNNTPGLHGIINSAGTYVVSYASPVLGPSTAAASTIFTPTTSGTYFIDTYSLYEGTYTLTATAIASDVPASTNSTHTVAVGGAVNGDIGGATDLDWYKVDLVGGLTYAIKMQGRGSGIGTLEDPIIAGIYNASGVLQSNTFSDDNDGTDAAVMFRPDSSGSYFIAADGYAGYTGTYKLSVTEVPGDVGHTKGTAAPTDPNTPNLVTIDDPADIDWYKVMLTANTPYVVRLQGTETKRGTLYDPVLLGIYNDIGVNGTLLPNTYVDDVGEQRNAKLAFTPTTTGYYYIAADGYDRFTGTMKLAVTTDYIGDTNATAKIITAGGAAEEGTIDSVTDVDRYGVDLEASSTYYFRMLGAFNRNGDLADPNIDGVYKSDGITSAGPTYLNDPVAVGTDAWAKVITTTAGRFYVDTASYNKSTEGTFLLYVQKEAAAGTTTNAVVAEIPGTYFGFIEEANDIDWIKATLNTNVSYLIRMRGFDTGEGTLVDPYINGIHYDTGGVIANTTNDSVDTRNALLRFIPTSSGTHYIEAKGVTTSTGSYLFSIETEPGNTTLSSWALPNPGSVTGTIDDNATWGADTDWYSVSLSLNKSYAIKMLGVDSGSGTLDNPRISSLRNSGGALIAGTDAVAYDSSLLRDSVIRYVPVSEGLHYIVAQSSAGTIGTYRLSIAEETGQTRALAWTMNVGTPVVGIIDDSSDIDYYKVALGNTNSYIFRMSGVDGSGGTLADPNIASIMDGTGPVLNMVASSSGRDAIVRWGPTTPGDYYIDARGGVDAPTANAGTFTLTVETEPGSTAASAWAMTVGNTVTGNIDDGTDTDWYRFTHNNGANVNYIITMRGASSGGGSLADPNIVGLRDSVGTALTNETFASSGTDSIVFWTPSSGTTADYIIETQGFGATTGTYSLNIVLDDAAATVAGARSITVGGSATGTIDALGDTDWYRFTHNTGTISHYIITMRGTSSGGGTLADPDIVGIRDSGGVALTGEAWTSSGTDSILFWSTSSATLADYIIETQGAAATTGTFTLDIVVDDVGSTAANAKAITVDGAAATGKIDTSADTDWYKFAHATSTGYIITMRGTSGGGTLSTPSIFTVRDSAGTAQSTGFVTVSSDATSTARWSPTSTALTDYFIDAQGGGATGTYDISIVAEAGNTTASAWTAILGTPVNGKIDDATDTDWYKVSLSANTRYVFTMSGTGSGGTLGAPAIQGLFDSNGTAITTETFATNGTDSLMYYQVGGTSGTFYVEAGASSGIGTYVITAQAEAGDSTTNDLPLTLVTPINAAIDVPGDIDWYTVSGLTTGRSYVFKMEGLDSGNGTLVDPYMPNLLTSTGSNTITGEIVAYAVGNDAAIRWVANTTSVIVNAQGAGGSGTYKISAQQEGGEDMTNAMGISRNITYNGAIDDTADIDFYSLTLANNVQHRVTMVGGTLTDSFVRVRNSTGSFNVTAEGTGANAELIFRTPGTTGTNTTYYIEADSGAANPTIVGSYTLMIETWP